ncbi:MAG: glycoside hydrolase family 1 protein [Candidatus Heimdallarchaeaceae archaeon]
MNKDILFPKGFLWGSAISAYQTEGGNYSNDWFEHEKKEGQIRNNDRCGEACDHYNLFESDHKLISKYGQNALRTGIEWSRIMPIENEVNEDEIEHYHKVFESLEINKLTSFINIHHFTVPLWFSSKGGFLKKKNLKFFEKYCEILSKNFPEVKYWNTINEPNIFASMYYLYAEGPPSKQSLIAFLKGTRNTLHAHAIAYHKIKEYNPKSLVGIVKNFPYFIQKEEGKTWAKVVAKIADKFFNQVTLDMLRTGKDPYVPFVKKKWLKDTSDFIGFNYYNVANFVHKRGKFIDLEMKLPNDKRVTQMDWGVYPLGLYKGLMRVHKELKIPIYVTENGLATLDDDFRQEYILKHLIQVKRAIDDGADIRGFFYWGAIDNFEWNEGFEPRFGLIGIDYKTQERIIKPATKMYEKIAKSNKITVELLEKFDLSGSK